MLRDTVSMRAPWVICASMLAFAATVAPLPGCGGYQTLLMPTRLRLSPGVTTAAPGEIIHYELKGFSLVGIEVPLPEQSVDWELEAAPLPDELDRNVRVHAHVVSGIGAVSYTHLTLPTIHSV